MRYPSGRSGNAWSSEPASPHALDLLFSTSRLYTTTAGNFQTGSQKFPRHKLANDGTVFDAGQAVATPSMIRAELIALFRDWEEAGLVEDFDQFKADLQVARSSTDVNRVDVRIPPNLINQFRVFAAQIQFRL
ncbi:hypothetical protein CJO93_08400 [Ralstonia solanacearum]|nr:hypothetical protein CJO93_08400 [Ralstonia solanacearum]